MYEETCWSTLEGGSDLSSESDPFKLFHPTKSTPPDNNIRDGLKEVRGEILYDFDQQVDFWDANQASFTYPYLSLLCFFREYEGTYWEAGLEVEITDGSGLWDVIDIDSHYAQDLESFLRRPLEDVETENGYVRRGVNYTTAANRAADVLDTGDITDSLERSSIWSPVSDEGRTLWVWSCDQRQKRLFASMRHWGENILVKWV